MSRESQIGLWQPQPNLSAAQRAAITRIPFTLTIDSADPCVLDISAGVWRQPFPMPVGQSVVTIRFTLTNLTNKDSAGIVSGFVGGSPIGSVGVAVNANDTKTDALWFYGAPQGTWPIVLRYDVSAGEIFNPAVGQAGLGAPLTKTLYETLAAVENTYVAEPWLILETDHVNPPYSTGDREWSKDRVGGQVFIKSDSPIFEWVPVLVPDDWFDKYFGVECEFSNDVLVGASGTVVSAERSNADLPFTHPFANDPDSTAQLKYGNYGLDFTFNMIPDPHYWRLLGPSPKDEFGRALPGPLHVEMDQGLLPADFRPGAGDRVAVFGRWVVDAGHDDFEAEIHPPLFLAVGRPGKYSSGELNLNKTTSTLVGRPYLTSQIFSRDGNKARGLRAHLSNEIYQAGTLAKYDIDLKVNVLPGWNGFGVDASYVVRPPTIRRHANDVLFAEYRFTVRAGVTVHVLDQGDDSIRVAIKIDGNVFAPSPVPPPGRHDVRIKIEDMPDRAQELRQELDTYIDDGTQNNPAGRAAAHNAVNKGANAVFYDAPAATIKSDGYALVHVKVAELPKTGSTIIVNDASNGTATDNDQPFPVYGYLNLYWARWDTFVRLASEVAGP